MGPAMQNTVSHWTKHSASVTGEERRERETNAFFCQGGMEKPHLNSDESSISILVRACSLWLPRVMGSRPGHRLSGETPELHWGKFPQERTRTILEV